MSPIPWASGGGIKVDRADKHVSDLETEVRAFRDSSPYQAIGKEYRNPEAGQYGFEWTVEVLRQPPLYLGAIAGDAIHNLRSALDILWRQTWYPGGGGRSNSKIQFPIFETPEDFEARFRRVVKPRERMAVALLKQIEPYSGGKTGIHELHRLDIADKHHVLLAIGGSSRAKAIRVKQVGYEEVSIPILPADHLVFPIEHGTVLGRLIQSTPLPDMHVNHEFTFFVALGEGEIFKGKPIVETLQHFAKLVRSIADAFLAEKLIR